MQSEYRVIFTATFSNSTDRDTFSGALKESIGVIKTTNPGLAYKRADVTADEYPVPDVATVSEKII